MWHSNCTLSQPKYTYHGPQSPVTTYGISFCRTGTCIRAYPKTLSRSLSYDFVNVIPCLVFWLARSPVSSANFLTHSHTHCIISHHHHSQHRPISISSGRMNDLGLRIRTIHASKYLIMQRGWLAGWLPRTAILRRGRGGGGGEIIIIVIVLIIITM